jgi:hypothetical protein
MKLSPEIRISRATGKDTLARVLAGQIGSRIACGNERVCFGVPAVVVDVVDDPMEDAAVFTHGAIKSESVFRGLDFFGGRGADSAQRTCHRPDLTCWDTTPLFSNRKGTRRTRRVQALSAGHKAFRDSLAAKMTREQESRANWDSSNFSSPRSQRAEYPATRS